MSNMLKTQLLKQSLSYALKTQPKRCFSVSKQYLNEQEPDIEFLSKRVQDVLADFEKPLIDSHSTKNDDPHTILIQSVEKFKPYKQVISNTVLEKLRTQLGNAYNVTQLRSILAAQKLKHKNLKKQQLITSIIENHWEIKTEEQVKEEAIQRQLNTVKQTFPASRHELFFIIGDNGNTIRSIEEQNQVNVNIDVINNQYIVEGLSEDVLKAKKEILSHLDIMQDTVNAPKFVLESQDLQTEIADALVDISKVAGTFISLKDGKFTLASLSTESMDNAKRLLSLMLKELNEDRKEVGQSTIVHNNHIEFTVLPLHDSPSMSLYSRKLNWNRIKSQRKDNLENTFKTLDGQEIGSMENLKDTLFKPFNQQLEDISLEARFGNLLFQQNSNNINTFTTTSDILGLYKNRTLFFPTMPPRQLTSPFIPLTLDGGFHQRSVQVEYTNKLLLEDNNNSDIELRKMNVEFTIDEQGEMELKNITGIKNQSIIDMLGVYGNVDIRLLANQVTDFSNNEELKHNLLSSCRLSSYSELNAPKTHSINNESNMILSNITFLNKKRFLVDNSNLVSVNHVEQQDNKLRRTEFMVNSVDPETLNITHSINRWPSFVNILSNISKKWDYST